MEHETQLSPGERNVLLYLWCAGAVVVALPVLSVSVTKSVLIGGFVLGSCILNFGRQWLLRGGLVVALVAIAVSLGLPLPNEWPGLVRSGLQVVCVPNPFSSVAAQQ